MSKTLTEATVSTRNARSKLGAGTHWRGLNADVHLGYRKGKRAGKWLVRWYVGDQKYRHESLGVADDALEADGLECLTFEQAKARALSTVKERKTEERLAASGPIPTVRSAVKAHIERRDAAERRTADPDAPLRRDAALRLQKHVLAAPVADVALHEIVEGDLADWRTGLPKTLAVSTVQRICNDFRSALNNAGKVSRRELPADFVDIIKAGLAGGEDEETPTARTDAALPDADVRRIIDAARDVDEEGGWDGDLLRFIVALAATGARFSQQSRIKVADVQATATPRLMLPVSRKGRGKKQVSHVAVAIGSDVLETLRPAFAGRRPGEWLFERWRHKQEPGQDGKPPKWVRASRGRWRKAAELQRPWAAIIKGAGLPAGTVPYALRHSSIVRNLRAGLPVRLVAQLHDTSSAMIERHYSAAINSVMDGVAATAVIPLVSESGKIVPLRAGRESSNPQG